MLKQKEWIDVIVEKTNCSKKEAKIYYDCVFDYIKEQISEEEPIKIAGFGVFKLRKTAAKEQVNLSTGVAEIVPEHQVVVFKPYIEIDPKPEAIEMEADEILPVAEEVVETEEIDDVEVAEETVEQPVEEVVVEEVVEEVDELSWIYNGEKKTTSEIASLLKSKTALSDEDILSSLNVVKANMQKLNKKEVEVKEDDDSFNFVVLK